MFLTLGNFTSVQEISKSCQPQQLMVSLSVRAPMPPSLQPLTVPRASFLPGDGLPSLVTGKTDMPSEGAALASPFFPGPVFISPLFWSSGNTGHVWLSLLRGSFSPISFYKLLCHCVWLWPSLPHPSRALHNHQFFLSLASNLASSVHVLEQGSWEGTWDFHFIEGKNVVLHMAEVPQT